MFELHPRLQADTHAVTSMTLCELRLMEDRRFPWLILVPRVLNITELHQLEDEAQHQLLLESSRVASALEQVTRPDKLNIGALGNLVPQLHWHIVARSRTDPCWPGPVWGCGESIPYQQYERRRLIDALLGRLND